MIRASPLNNKSTSKMPLKNIAKTPKDPKTGSPKMLSRPDLVHARRRRHRFRLLLYRLYEYARVAGRSGYRCIVCSKEVSALPGFHNFVNWGRAKSLRVYCKSLWF